MNSSGSPSSRIVRAPAGETARTRIVAREHPDQVAVAHLQLGEIGDVALAEFQVERRVVQPRGAARDRRIFRDVSGGRGHDLHQARARPPADTAEASKFNSTRVSA